MSRQSARPALRSRIYDFFVKPRYWFTKPIPQMLSDELSPYTRRLLDRLYSAHPALRAPLCKSKKSRSIALWAAAALGFAAALLALGEWNPIRLFTSLPFWEYADFLDAVGHAPRGVLGYVFWIILSYGLGSFVMLLLQRFLIGETVASFRSADGLAAWLLNLYVYSLSSAAVYPLLVRYSLSGAAQTHGLASLLSYTGLITLMAFLVMMFLFPDAFESTAAFVLSAPAFRLYTGLYIHVVFAAVFEVVNAIAHTRVFQDMNFWLSVPLVILTQLFWDFLRERKSYVFIMSVIRFFMTSYLGLGIVSAVSPLVIYLLTGINITG